MLTSLMEPADFAKATEVFASSGVEVDLAAEGAKPWARLWVARVSEGAEPIACLVAWSVADELHVLQVATRPDQRRRGAATALVDTAIRYAAGQHARMVLLEVRRSNSAAIHLYRSRGFHAIGVRRGYYASDGEDALEMMLNLDPVTGAVQPGRDEISPFEP